MTPKLNISIKPTQKLLMTPVLQQSLKILQVPRMEVEELISQEMKENPLLEESEPGIEDEELQIEDINGVVEDSSPDGHNQDLGDTDLDAYFDDQAESGEGQGHPSVFEDRQGPSWENSLVHEEDLYDHLLWQLQMLNLTSEQRELAEYIIGNLDADGFLVATCEEIQAMGSKGFDSCEREADRPEASAKYSKEAVVDALEVVRSLDPPGIAFCTRQESLLRQLDLRGEREHSLACRMVAEKWDDLIHRRFGAIAKSLGVPLAQLQPAVKSISTLSPRPGRQYSNDRTQYVEPDVFVVKVGDSYVVQLNDNGLPRLRVCQAYRRMLKTMSPQGLEGEAQRYIKKKMRSAIELIRGLNLRQRTIYKVAVSIVKQQRDFLDNGLDHLRPLVLRNVAEDIEMHESTVSRVVSNKYMNTPRGLLPMKFFFHSGIDSKNGSGISSQSIKRKIQQLIQDEDLHKPLSDSDLRRTLGFQGIHIARRTVAKYREDLGIQSSSERKQLF